MSATGRPANATIHDLGYQRYLGARRPQRDRWRSIFRNAIGMAWRGWWSLKVWVIGAFIATVSFGAVLYVSQNDIFGQLLGHGRQVTFADALIPFAFLPPFFPFLAFITSLATASTTIASDLSAGAFEFYFSRPVRPIDYLVGKVGALFTIAWLVVGLGPLLLSLFRLGLAVGDGHTAAALLMVVKVAVLGVAGALTFSAVPLAFSALADRRRTAQALWAGYYFIGGGLVDLIASQTDMPWLAVLDVKSALTGLSMGLFELHFREPGPSLSVPLNLVGLAVMNAAALALAYRRVARAQRDGMGGG